MAARVKKADAVSMALVIAPSIPYTAKLRSVDMIGMRHEQASNWGVVVLIAGGVLLTPIFGFLIALVVDILIGLLKDGGVPALLTLVVAGVIGGFLFRTMLPPPVVAPQSGREAAGRKPDEVALSPVPIWTRDAGRSTNNPVAKS